MPGFKIVVGFFLVFAGCQIPWFFTAAAGLLLGDFIALYILNLEQTWDIFIHDLKYGVLAFLASFINKRIGVILGAGLFCAFLVRNLPALFNVDMDWFSWQYYVIAAAIGILAVYFLKTFAVVVISSISGGVLVAQNSDLGTVSPWFTMLAMMVIGIATQFILLRHYNPDQDEPQS